MLSGMMGIHQVVYTRKRQPVTSAHIQVHSSFLLLVTFS